MLASGDLPRVAAIGEHELTVSGYGVDPWCSGRRRGLLRADLGPARLRLLGSRLRR